LLPFETASTELLALSGWATVSDDQHLHVDRHIQYARAGEREGIHLVDGTPYLLLEAGLAWYDNAVAALIVTLSCNAPVN